MLSRLFIAALWLRAGKGLTSWLLLVMFNCVFVTFHCGILGQVWYSIPDLCRISFFISPWSIVTANWSGLKAPAEPSCRVPTYIVYFFQIHPR